MIGAALDAAAIFLSVFALALVLPAYWARLFPVPNLLEIEMSLSAETQADLAALAVNMQILGGTGAEARLLKQDHAELVAKVADLRRASDEAIAAMQAAAPPPE